MMSTLSPAVPLVLQTSWLRRKEVCWRAFRLSDGFVISDDGDLNDEDARGSIRLSPRGGYAAREQVMPRTHRVGSRLPHGGAAVATAQIQDLGYDGPRLR